jgi:hypothetical protein
LQLVPTRCADFGTTTGEPEFEEVTVFMNSNTVLVGLAGSDVNGISAYPATMGVR